MEHALLKVDGLPEFAAIKTEEIEPSLRALLEAQRRQIRMIEATPYPTFATVIEPLEQMQHRLSRVWSPVSHLNGVQNGEALRVSYNACLPLLSEYQTDLGQSEALYRAYQTILASESERLSSVQRRVIEQALRDFRLSGVGLPDDKKDRFKSVMQELTQLQAKFEENVLDATNAWSKHVTDAAQLRGLNATIIEQARARAIELKLDGWVLSLQQPTYVAVMTDAESAELRREYYEAWSTRASDRGPSAGQFDNSPVMERILALRHEAAELVGFANFAQYALATRMAKSPREVFDFLNRLAQAARPAAQRELAELEQYAGRRLDAWDISYYAEKLQHERYAVTQEELRPYFQLPRVLAGLFGVAERLFGVRIVERQNVPSWHADVRFFDIEASAGERLGSFYLDAYARPNKRSGAWMDDCIGRIGIAGTAASPVAYLVCNFLPPANGKPALLTHDDVVTLFHEFGHGLHHMLTRVAYPSIAGINGVAWDAVELPSQFMENFAWHAEVLTAMSAHIDTGAPLPADKRQKLLATRVFHAGLATVRQLEFALFDFRLHAEYSPRDGARIESILREVRESVAVIRAPEWNRFAHNFGHIFAGGYAAGYYSYKWAEVLSADAFEAFEEQGTFDRATAQRFLDTILSQGGSRDALDAFVAFRGRKPDVQALLKSQGLAA